MIHTRIRTCLAILSLGGFSLHAASSGLYLIDDAIGVGEFTALLTPATHGGEGWAEIDDTFDGTVAIRFEYTPRKIGDQDFTHYWSYLLLRDSSNSIKFRVGTDHGSDTFMAPVAGSPLRHEGDAIPYEERTYDIQIVLEFFAGEDDSATVIIDGMVFPLVDGDYGFEWIQAVAAHDGGGPGADFTNLSVEVSLTEPGPPRPPFGLAAVGSADGISLSWSAVSGADTYNVKRAETGGDLQTIASTAATEYVDTDVVDGVTYDYAVASVSSEFGEGDLSTVATATAETPPRTEWAGFPINEERVADTEDWLGRVHVFAGDWVYIEPFGRFFAALPTGPDGVWIHSRDDYSLGDGWQNTEKWLGWVYGAGDFIYSWDLNRWFYPHALDNGEGTWLFSMPAFRSAFPAERLFAWDAGVRGGIPEVPVAIELDPADLGGPNASPVIQAAIEEVANSGEPGAVLLPEGAFYITQAIVMRSGVVLRGRGLDKTSLLMNNPDSSEGIIRIVGSPMGHSGRPILAGYEAGSHVLELTTSIGFTAGGMAYLNSDNDIDVMYGDHEDWRQAGETMFRRSVAQVVGIAEVDGNSLILDTPARLDRMHLNPTVRPIIPIENAGVESLHLRFEQDATDAIIRISRAVNSWVRDCELEFTTTTHISIGNSRYITVESNYIHHSYNYGGGGRGYGVATGGGSSDNLIWNNVFRMLRHAMLTSTGANGNIWAYNYSREQHQDGTDRLRDISVHGNYPYMELFEGNVAEFATSSDWWGAAGPLVTFFRNRFDTRLNHKPNYGGWNAPLQILYRSHEQNVVGNSMVSGQGIQVQATSMDALVEGNLVHGSIVWNETEPRARNLPHSVFLRGAPPFWGDTPWPAIGADFDVTRSPDYIRIPAQVWGERILLENRAMPFHEAMAD